MPRLVIKRQIKVLRLEIHVQRVRQTTIPFVAEARVDLIQRQILWQPK